MVSNLTVKVGADIQGLQKELKKATSHLNAFGKGMDSISSHLKGMAAGIGIATLGQQIIRTTAEFEKFEAVLTNTLGSKGAAKLAMAQISTFAAKTPFQVNELTESFVKLANQGFVPTTKEMTSLGDLASSMGKSFDQLTEAIIDAQTGEFERLKEFGIRAEKQGDKVTFTFKGVKQQVDFTADSIREYVLSLGSAEGVSGGMAMQSETLGGKLSNLKDSLDQLLLSMGQLLTKGGVVNDVLEGLARNIQMAAGTYKGDQKLGLENLIKKLKEIQAVEKMGSQRWVMLNDEILAVEGALRSLTKTEEDQAAAAQAAAEARKKAAAADLARIEAEYKALRKRLSMAMGAKQSDTVSKDDASGSFLLDLGVFAQQAERYAAIGDRIAQTNNAIKVSQDALIPTNDWAQVWVDWADVVGSAIGQLAQSLGEASVGVGNFGEDILKMVGSFAQQLGEALIASGTAVLIAKSQILTNPYAAIAAGAVLVAAGSALNAGISKSVDSLGKSSGSSHRAAGGSGSRGAVGGLGSNGMEIQVGGEFRIQGQDLVYIFNRQNQLNGRTRG